MIAFSLDLAWVFAAILALTLTADFVAMVRREQRWWRVKESQDRDQIRDEYAKYRRFR